MADSRLKRWAALLFPVLFAAVLFRRSFRIWFLNDDFAWLGLRLGIHHPADLWTALFGPMAQGTVRTLSERLFFLGFEWGFGMESLPMRLFAFATFALALVLCVLVVERLSGSLLAGVAAACLWALNFGVTVGISWISSYNQILLVTLFLATLYGFMRGWMLAAWAAYLLAFGALENAVVIPVILLAYAWLFERQRVRTTLPFFVPAVLFAAAHLWLIPKVHTSPTYQMHWDASILESLAVYWDWALGAARLIDFHPIYGWMLTISHLVLTPALLVFVVWRVVKRDFVAPFLLFAGLALIGPMLPLRDHRTDYYLASASFGLAGMLALVPLRMGPAGWAVVALYAVPSFIVQQATIEWYLNRTAPLRPLIRGLMRACQLHPGKMLMLEGISDEVYYSSFIDEATRLIGGCEVRLEPGSGPAGNPFALAPAAARAAIESQSVVVYRFDGSRLYDITRQWESTKAYLLLSGLSPEILTGDKAYAAQLAGDWYESEGTHRWMGRRGTFRLGGPGKMLVVEGFVPAAMGSFELRLTLGGKLLKRLTVGAGALKIEAPLGDAGRSQTIEGSLESSKTIQPQGDGRTLSILVTKISVR
jgi:hypothetical protein